MWILLPKIDLRCFVAKQFLSRIYAFFWCTFYRPRKCVGVQKTTNMRYGYWYWLRLHESFLNLKVGLQKLRSQDPSNRGHGRALIQERYWRGAFFRCLEVSRKKLVELVRITLSLPPLTDAPLPLIANSGWFLTKKSPPWSLLLVAFSKCKKLAGQLKLSLGDGIAILVRKDVGNPSDYFKKRFTEYQQGFESWGKFHSHVQTESIFVKSFKTYVDSVKLYISGKDFFAW